MADELRVLGKVYGEDWDGRDRFFIIGTDPKPYIHAYLSGADETHPDAERFHFTPEEAQLAGMMLLEAGWAAGDGSDSK